MRDAMPSPRRAPLTPGAAVRVGRELMGLTQVELAAATGLSQAAISAVESGAVPLGLERAKKLALALHVHPSVLLFSDWEPNARKAG